MKARVLFPWLAAYHGAKKGFLAGTDSLVAYFSWSGFTGAVAKIIGQKTGSRVFEIEPAEPYPADFRQCLARAKAELAILDWPELKSPLHGLEDYETIFLGFPNWLGSLPRVVATFVKLYDLNDKTLIPFCANGEGGPGQSIEELESLLPLATMLSPLILRVCNVTSLPKKIDPWLTDLGF